MKRSSSTSVFNDRGFTLIEILIAITLLAFITLAVVNVTENAFLTKDRTTEINKNNLQIETAMSRFEWDFAQIYSPLYFSTVMNMNQNNMNQFGNDGSDGGFVGNTTGSTQGAAQQGAQGGAMNSPLLQQYYEQLVTRFERNEHFSAVSKEGYPIPRFYSPDKSTFEFFTSSNRRKLQNMKQSHFAWVRYALAAQQELPSDEGKEENPNVPKSLRSLVRYYTADDPYSDKRINIDDVDRVKGAVLLRNVEALEFQFWNLNRRKWETNIKTVPQGESVLHGVRMLVTWYDSAGNKRTTSRIFRTHWPLQAPQDQATTTTTPQGGATAGTTGVNMGNQDGGNDGF
ncbi:PulJ/GspJ family protein [Peredibacter starrii]|uniref:Prepilin-type N-terminal cleavage/methylation domain-containing protein n=1 Tax=Peredibacter starrii TaxID=28202 RepID=A0AAX4HL80_9BACT|nr:prepilin-type N-terminal cleavage/methylation domain-containing protein [Peredibacter starrii]WPU64015.1 prepilin-type N-terminal cleavage/methylation domain-containing protein [Peredibacter starrii]